MKPQPDADTEMLLGAVVLFALLIYLVVRYLPVVLPAFLKG